MNIVVLAVLVVVLSILISSALVGLLRGSRIGTLMQGTGDVEGIYITVIGALYAIFIAFMIFVVWTRFDAAENSVDQEADTLVNLYRLAEELPQPLQSEMRQAVVDYAHSMIRDEWPAMAEERSSAKSQAVVERMWDVVHRMDEAAADDVIRDHVLTTISELTELRRYRLLQSQTNLPGILYAALFFGGTLTIVLAALFSVEQFWSHVLKAAVLAALTSFMLLVVWVLDHPFQGDVYVQPTAFERSLEIMTD